MSELEATFSYERSTKNTHRYQEDDAPPKIGSLYVQKWALDGTPKKIKVTVEVLE